MIDLISRLIGIHEVRSFFGRLFYLLCYFRNVDVHVVGVFSWLQFVDEHRVFFVLCSLCDSSHMFTELLAVTSLYRIGAQSGLSRCSVPTLQSNFYTTFLKSYGSDGGLLTTACLKTAAGCKEGHSLSKVTYQQILFSVT